MLAEAGSRPMVAADFQSIYAALRLLTRLPNGRYPERNDALASWLLPLTEYTRQSVITGAQNAEIDLVVTNSDSRPERRQLLLERMGPDSREIIIDPGYQTAADNLSGVIGMPPSSQCAAALLRWFRAGQTGIRPGG